MSQKSGGYEKQERNRGIVSILRGGVCANFEVNRGVTVNGVNGNDFIERKSEQSL